MRIAALPPIWTRVAAPSRRLTLGMESCEVYEMESDSDGHVVRCLVFNTSTRVRRLRRYPADWRTRPDQELFSLGGLD